MRRQSKKELEAAIQAEAEANEPKTYEEAAVEEPPRLVDIPSIPQQNMESTGEVAEPKTFSDALESSNDLTDMQAAQKRLFPPTLGDNIYNHIMVDRVDPNSHMARCHLNSVDEIMHSDPLRAVDINQIWQKHTILLNIGLDGMGRIDDLELAGEARETKRLQSTMAGLGGGLG